MNTLQDIAYGVLCCVVVLESIALRSILQETLWLKRLSCPPLDAADTDALASTADMPRFRARILDSPETVSDAALRGREVLFLFLKAASALALRPEVLAGTVYALWNKTDDCLYVVCEGSEENCRLLSDRYRLRERYGESVQVLLDDSSELTALFGVIATPSAILFDEDGSAKKTGRLSNTKDSFEAQGVTATNP